MTKEIKGNVIFARDEDQFLIKIEKKDIYYIETIKSTHYCHIFYKKGAATLQGDIKELAKTMGDGFLKVKSSTVVNLSHVIRIDKENRILYFAVDERLNCSYAAKNYTLLKRLLNIRSYRSYKDENKK